jgi:hypothetical protein
MRFTTSNSILLLYNAHKMYIFFLCLIKQHTTKTYRGMEIQLLSTALDGGTLSISCPSPFTLGERALDTHLVGCWKVPGLIWIL